MATMAEAAKVLPGLRKILSCAEYMRVNGNRLRGYYVRVDVAVTEAVFNEVCDGVPVCVVFSPECPMSRYK